MTKGDFVKAVAEEMDVSASKASAMIDGVLKVLSKTLSEKETVTFVGFGTFGVRERAAREGKNLHTGETIQIPAATVPYFKPGKTLKESCK